jgi:type III pantothenate kinase
MLLAFDIGNTNIVVGCFEGQKLLFEFRLKTEAGRTIDEYEAILFSLFDRKLGQGYTISRCIISSVVPPVTPDIVSLVTRVLKIEPIIVGPGIKTGLAIKTTEPGAVGADRIVNSVAGRELFGAPVLIVDFGTATSFDFVNAQGEYEGGIIAPGLNVALDSLVRNTAKLPRIELSWPKTVIGKNTVGAMQSGAVIGYVAMVDGLIDRVQAEVGKIPHLVATGGLGSLITKHSARVTKYEPHLTLHGMRIIASLNQ